MSLYIPTRDQIHTVAVTGTRNAGADAEALKTHYVDYFFDNNVGVLFDRRALLVHGACEGTDIRAAMAAKRHGMRVRAVVPTDRSHVDPRWSEYADEAIIMGPETTYHDRDLMVVETANLLIAWPKWHENDPQSKRSGTWLTVRLADKMGIPVLFQTLSANAHPSTLRRNSARGLQAGIDYNRVDFDRYPEARTWPHLTS